jgi:hypothetical protein
MSSTIVCSLDPLAIASAHAASRNGHDGDDPSGVVTPNDGESGETIVAERARQILRHPIKSAIVVRRALDIGILENSG